MSCKHYTEMKSSERKHLRMKILHKNKDSRSNDQNKCYFHFISPAMKINVTSIFSMAKLNFISDLM